MPKTHSGSACERVPELSGHSSVAVPAAQGEEDFHIGTVRQCQDWMIPFAPNAADTLPPLNRLRFAFAVVAPLSGDKKHRAEEVENVSNPWGVKQRRGGTTRKLAGVIAGLGSTFWRRPRVANNARITLHPRPAVLHRLLAPNGEVQIVSLAFTHRRLKRIAGMQGSRP